MCITFGNSSFRSKKWNIHDALLIDKDSIVNVGVTLSNNTKAHTQERIKSTRRALYGLQGAGLGVNGSKPDTIVHIYNTAIRPVLTYGLQCVYQCKTAIDETEKLQCKLLKSSLGLKSYCRHTLLLHAL